MDSYFPKRQLGATLLNFIFSNYFDTINPTNFVPLNPEKYINTDFIVQASYPHPLSSFHLVHPTKPLLYSYTGKTTLAEPPSVDRVYASVKILGYCLL